MIKKPLVSILTPTYNRRIFIPQYLKYVCSQDYNGPIEILIADDGEEYIEDLVVSDSRIRYVRFKERKSLGFKRNVLNEMAKGDIFVNMDDDDYYPINRVSHAVSELIASDKLIAGSSSCLIYNTTRGEIVECGPFGLDHGTCGTFAFFREYVKKHKFDDGAKAQEEPSFTNGFIEPMAQLDPLSTILIIQHKFNTWDKSNTSTRPSKVKIHDIVKDHKDRRFYRKLN
jgi:glycosyltransferase involved in cell wall biosynthesis